MFYWGSATYTTPTMQIPHPQKTICYALSEDNKKYRYRVSFASRQLQQIILSIICM